MGVYLSLQGTQDGSLLWGDPHGSEQLGLGITTTQPSALEPVLHSKRSHHREQPTLQLESSPSLLQLEKVHLQPYNNECLKTEM